MTEEGGSMSGLSEISVRTSFNEIPVLRDEKSPEEIFEHICREARGTCREISKIARQRSQSTNAGINVEKTVVMPEMTSLLESKAHVINQLTNRIKDTKVSDYPHFRGEAAMSIPVMMAEETDSCEKACQFLDQIKGRNEQYQRLLQESDRICHEMETTEIAPRQDDDVFTKIQSAVNKDFKMIKTDMNNLMDSLYGDSNIAEVLLALVEKSSSKQTEDEWYDVPEPSHMIVILKLVADGVVVLNEKNPRQVKLII